MTPFSLYTLPAGKHTDPANDTWLIDVTNYRDINIVGEHDARGEAWGETISLMWEGQTCFFNTLSDAELWLDDELDTDHGFDPHREWGIGMSRAV